MLLIPIVIQTVCSGPYVGAVNRQISSTMTNRTEILGNTAAADDRRQLLFSVICVDHTQKS